MNDGVLLVAVASDTTSGAASPVSAHFGRCPAYTFAQVEGGAVSGYRVVENPHFVDHVPGAVPAFLHREGANVVLSGGMGPRAVQMFMAAGIQVATGACGTVADAVADWVSGRLRGTAPCEHDHPDSCGGHGEGRA